MVSRSCVVLKSLCGRSGGSVRGLWVWCGLCLGVWCCLVWLCDVLCGCLVVSVALGVLSCGCVAVVLSVALCVALVVCGVSGAVVWVSSVVLWLYEC